jgi:hypothetical protein
VSFNTRSNIFGGNNSPIQRLGGFAGSGIALGSEYRAPSSIFRGNESLDMLRDPYQQNKQHILAAMAKPNLNVA